MPTPSPPPGTPLYAERLTPPWWLAALAAFMVLSLAVAVLVPLGPWWALGVLVVFGGLCGWGLRASAARVEVGEGELRAGPAHIPVTLLGPAVPLDRERAALLRGRDIDPSAYHLIRGWVATAVRADVLDRADPTPYWYVATRHPDRLAAALEAARGRG